MDLKGVLIFLGGAIVGGGISYFATSYFLERKHKTQIEKLAGVANSGKEDLVKKEEALNEEKKKFDQVLADFEKKQKERLAAQTASREYSAPKVITEEEAGELPYPILYFHYYSDGTITNKDGEVVESPESFLGNDYESMFIDQSTDIYLSSSFHRRVFVIQPMNEPYDGDLEETEYGVDDYEDY